MQPDTRELEVPGSNQEHFVAELQIRICIQGVARSKSGSQNTILTSLLSKLA